MGDIHLGLLALGMLATALFVVGRMVGERVSRFKANCLAGLTFVLLVVYTLWLWDQVLLAWVLPFENLIVVGNWYPLAGAFLGGLAFAKHSQSSFRRWLPVLGLELAATATLASPLWGATPRCGNQWDSTGVCLQTTNQTCSAASAATLLKLHGINATEQEMAELCLTRNGTSWMGLYRGLKKKTAGTKWDVEVFACSSEDLRSFHQPAILSVGLAQNSHADPIYQTEWGWTPGMRHSVVLLSFVGNHFAEIAEPSQGVGRESWPIEVLNELFCGQGLRLVERRQR